MKNKVAFITGGARGLGAGLAKQIIDHGGFAFVVDVKKDGVLEQVQELGESADGCVCDVTDLASLEKAMTQCAERFGGIDFVVANAGILRLSSIEHMDPSDFHNVMSVNSTGVFNTIRAAIPHLRLSKGYIQVVSSLAAAIHVPLMSHYAASKAAAEALADVARQELAPDGIDVGCVHPTFAKTDMIKENDTGLLWGGHKGAFGAVEANVVVDAMYKGLANRTRKIIAPKSIAPLILAPGLFHRVAEGLSRMQGSNERLKDFLNSEAKSK